MNTLLFAVAVFFTCLHDAMSGDHLKDHIFVFQGESVEVDCTGDYGNTEPILMYRKKVPGDPVTYYVGGDRRPAAPEYIKPKQVTASEFLYSIDSAVPEDGGEYECDWSPQNDELNHYVNVVDKSSLGCPEVPPVVDAGQMVDGVQCHISKSGALEKAWLNDGSKSQALGLKFTIEDSQGSPFPVVYEETADRLTAKATNLRLHKNQNNTSIVCKFVSIHGTEASCPSKPVVVNCDETNAASQYCKDPEEESDGNSGNLPFLCSPVLLLFLLAIITNFF